LVSLLIYGVLVGTLIYEVVESPAPNQTASRSIVGGFWLTRDAKRQKRKSRVTTQRLLEGAAYDLDLLWSRFSRALAKVFMTLFYLGLTVCGSLALTCAAMILMIQAIK